MKTYQQFMSEAGDWWHPDPEKDRRLGGPGANQRAREDRAAASAPKKDYSKSLKPGESYMDFAKRKARGESYVPGKPAEKLGAVTAIPKDERQAALERIKAKTAAKRKGMKEGYYDPMEDPDFDHDEAEATRGQSGKNKSLVVKKKAKKTTKEELEIEEGMSLKDFKANRRTLKRREASADAKKRGHVGKEWYNSGRTYSPDEAKRSRANMDDEERRTRHRSAVDPDDDNDNNYSANKTKNVKKQRKQKAMGELG